MRSNKITPEVEQRIREANKLLTGNVTQRCEKLKKQFGYCDRRLANIIRDPDAKSKKDQSPERPGERDAIRADWLLIPQHTGMQYRIGQLSKKYNRDGVFVKRMIGDMIEFGQPKKMFRPEGEYHGMYI